MNRRVAGVSLLVGGVLVAVLMVAGFGHAVTLADNSTTHVQPTSKSTWGVSVAAADADNWAMMYADSTPNLMVRVSDDAGSTWGSEVDISDGSTVPRMTTNEQSQPNYDILYKTGSELIAAWRADEPERDMVIAQSDDGGSTWGSPITATSGVGEFGRNPNLVGEGENVWLSYRNFTNGDLEIVESSDGGDTWGSPKTIVSFDDSYGYQINYHGSDTLTVGASDDSNGECTFLKSTDGGQTWGTSVIVESDPLCLAAGMDLDLDSGFGVFAYLNDLVGDNNYEMVYHVTTDGGSTWSTADDIETTSPYYWSDIGLTSDFEVDVIGEDTAVLGSAGESSASSDSAPTFAYTTDGGSNWEVHRSTPTDSNLGTGGEWGSDLALVDESAGAYAVGYPGGQLQILANANLSGGPSIPAGVQALSPDKTASGFTDLQDLAVDFTLADATVFARERNSPTFDPQRVIQFNESLAEETPRIICSDSGAWDGYQESLLSYGLGISQSGKPAVVCENSEDFTPSLHQLYADGSYDNLSPVWEGNIFTEQSHMPVDGRTDTEVYWGRQTGGQGGSLQVERVNFDNLASQTLDWEWEDFAVSQDADKKVVISGPDGTTLRSGLGGSRLVSDLGVSFDSVEVNGSSVYAATGTEVRRYDVSGNSWDLQNSTTFETTAVHRLDLSADGRYLAAVSQTNVTVFDASNLDRLAITNITFEPRAAGIDANNDYLYAINATKVFRFPIFNKTVSFDGEAGETGSPNPASSGDPTPADPLTNETDGGTDEDPVASQDEGLFGSNTIEGIASGLGVNDTGASIFLAGLLIAGLTLGAGFLGSDFNAGGTGAAFGALAGTVLSFGLGLLPLWFLMVITVIGVAIVVMRADGGV